MTISLKSSVLSDSPLLPCSACVLETLKWMPRIKPWCLWKRSVIGVCRHVPKHLPSRLSCIYADRLSKRLVLSMDVSYDTLMPCGVQFITIGTHPACSYHDSLSRSHYGVTPINICLLLLAIIHYSIYGYFQRIL